MELRHWTIFGLLDSEFIQNIKKAAVFGILGQEALIIDKNDDVWELGGNSLGLDNSSPPVKIEALCHKGIKSFSYGAGPHVIAVTESGSCFGWGHNGFCQLGLGISCQTVGPSLITGSLHGKKVVQAACGSHHSVVLTSDGEIYAFGQNSSGQVGCGSTANQATPRRVSGAIGNIKIVSIACGQNSSFAVGDTGEIFSFGYNGTGQLGLGNTVNQYSPAKVMLPSAFIVKCCAGAAHTLALSDDGVLYSWGSNSYGQLGLGHKSNITSPTRVATEIGRIIDIAASHYSHISALQTHTKVYMWGQCRGQAIQHAMETNFKTLDDVFACYSTPSVCWRPIETKDWNEVGIVEALDCAFDDPVTSDVKFSVEGKIINAHKSILKIRSEFFRSMFQGKWEENTEPVLTIDKSVTYLVFRAYLKYLYTDKIDLPPEDSLDLLRLANYYCETQLLEKCEILIKQTITIGNAAKLYASAIQCNAKELEEFTFQYILHHLTKVIKSESFLELTSDGDLIKNLMLQLADSNAFRY